MSDRLRIFLSYSRIDREIAEEVAARIRNLGYEVFRDLDDILPTEAWKERLQELIEKADAIVFLLSPSSALSEVCQWEVELAESLKKKIAPIVIKDVEGEKIPKLLSRLNYIFATEADRLDNAVSSLNDALSGTAEWLREHTRLSERALTYQRKGKRFGDLLRSDEIIAAQNWLASKPSEVDEVDPKILSLLSESENGKNQRELYLSQRLRALSDLVEPLLQQRISELEERKKEIQGNMGSKMGMADMGGADAEIKAIENFAAEEGRWHPQPAVHHTSTGAISGYAEVWQFPCCEKFDVLAVHGIVPYQFSASGCEKDPASD